MGEPADSERQGSLRDLVERLLPFGGAPPRERVRDVVDDLVARGRLSPEAADELADELADSFRGAGQRVTDRASGAISALADQLGLVRERQVEELELRVAQLEHRVRLLEAAADEKRAPPPG
jgi:polyhydroxyalkanoate synthesis regulator phasin